MKNVDKRKLIYYVIVISIVFIIFLCFYNKTIREIFKLVFVSFAISYTLKPLQNKLVQNGLKKKFSAVMLIIVLFLIFTAVIMLMIPSLLKESLNINVAFSGLQNLFSNLYNQIKPFRNNKTVYGIIDNFNNRLNSMLVNGFSNIFAASLNLGENIVNITVIPIISYYFLSEGDSIRNRIIIIFPVSIRNMLRSIYRDIDRVLGRYIISQLFLCLLIGIATFMILIKLKVSFPIMLSLINAFFNIIPYFGPIFGAIPAVLIALICSTKTAVWTAVWLYILQLVEGNIISPKITGDSVNIHPLLVIILLVLGGKIAGFVGMVLAIPVAVIIKIIYEDLDYYLF